MNFIASLMKHRRVDHAALPMKTCKNVHLKQNFSQNTKYFSRMFQGYLLILFRFVQA